MGRNPVLANLDQALSREPPGRKRTSSFSSSVDGGLPGVPAGGTPRRTSFAPTRVPTLSPCRGHAPACRFCLGYR